MQIGMMNNPKNKLLDEIRFAGDNEFDYLDLTLEPPGSMIQESEIDAVKSTIESYKLSVVGHYAWYLPVDSPFDQIRDAACQVCKEQMTIFAALGARKVTLHAGFSYPDRFFSYDQKLNFWCRSMDQLIQAARENNLTLMMENVAGRKDQFRILRDLLKRYPDLGFHLDVGHANLDTPMFSVYEYLRRFKKRLIHVHLSDNFGRKDDLHLPIGAGGIPWKQVIKLIQRTRYDETITLEVFSSHREYLLKSREILRNLWADGDK